MKVLGLLFLFIGTMISGASASSACTNSKEGASPDELTAKEDTTMSHKINIAVNNQSFTATLFDNDTAGAFIKMLPLTIDMIELNGNEKYYDLPNSLPVNASNPGTIQNGDIMLFGSRTLVLFYQTFSTSYRYTKLGQVDDPAGLEAALGPGNVTVTFEEK